MLYAATSCVATVWQQSLCIMFVARRMLKAGMQDRQAEARQPQIRYLRRRHHGPIAELWHQRTNSAHMPQTNTSHGDCLVILQTPFTRYCSLNGIGIDAHQRLVWCEHTAGYLAAD
jgi:uncharacterized protein YfaQ (DUF2300 family)